MIDVTGSPADNPAFLDPARAESIGYVGAPDAIPTFDSELIAEDPEAPSRGIIDRYRELARRHAYGQTNRQIAVALGYTDSRVSLILLDPFVQSEIARHRDSFFNGDANVIMKETSVQAARNLQSIVNDPSHKKHFEASTFVAEKVTGKARQEITVESGTLTGFMDLLKSMQGSGEMLDVTPTLPATAEPSKAIDAPQPSRFDAWIDQHLA